MLELPDLIEHWFGLEPDDMTMFNCRERNRYVRMLSEDKVFQQFMYIDLHTGRVSHRVHWAFCTK